MRRPFRGLTRFSLRDLLLAVAGASLIFAVNRYLADRGYVNADRIAGAVGSLLGTAALFFLYKEIEGTFSKGDRRHKRKKPGDYE